MRIFQSGKRKTETREIRQAFKIKYFVFSESLLPTLSIGKTVKPNNSIFDALVAKVVIYFTVTDFAKFLGISGSLPRRIARR